MKEILDVIRAYDEARLQGKQTALSTVVHVDGSSYRRPGARMLVDDVGQLTGAISGGCLEGDALRKAMLVLTQQKSKLVTYDTMDEDDAKFGIGLGCNGIIQVLIEPVNPADPYHPIALLKAFAGGRRSAVLVTLFSLNKWEEQPGTCLLYQEGETIAGGPEVGGLIAGGALPSALKDVLAEEAKKAFADRVSSFKNFVSQQQDLTAFIEYLRPPVSLVVIGAGNDVIPLIRMADILGWQTCVIDGRSSHAKPGRFAASCQVLVSKPEKALEQISIDEQTVFILMTHNYNYDLAMLRGLIGRRVPYIGSLGPQKKLDRMLDELRAEGLTIDDAQLRPLYGPSGLDIGAETPEEIALSILAEIKAVLAGRNGQPLRNNHDVIHARDTTLIQKIELR